RDEPRARFTLAHEVGHACLHRAQVNRMNAGNGKVVLYRKTKMPLYVSPEWQADDFAGCLLAPGDAVRKIAEKPRFNLVHSVATKMKISVACASIRCKKVIKEDAERELGISVANRIS